MLIHEWMRQRDRRGHPLEEEEVAPGVEVAEAEEPAREDEAPPEDAAGESEEQRPEEPAQVWEEAEEAEELPPFGTSVQQLADQLEATPPDRPAPPPSPARSGVVELLGVPEAQSRRLQALIGRQGRLPLEVQEASPPPRRGHLEPAESREELIERLLDPILSINEAATLCSVCPASVRRYTNRGVLKCFRTPGNQRRFRLSDVLDFMERQQQETLE